ncbi:MAG TPA: glycosyltransferase family 39 protein, partial [Vicinamibacterales bacterium]|nr:glycosyltransferase family 39 protein [Vicinamibacterales bacterium]
MSVRTRRRPIKRPPDRPTGLPFWVLLPALLLVTLAAYYPAWHGGFLWDDDAHITRVDLRSLHGLWRIWFEVGATQQYYPVTHSAFWLLHRMFGDVTLGYHLVNIGLHATSAFLFAVILRRLAVPGAVLAAFIFALHPVHVESVAWITELKNTLSAVLYLGAFLAYLHFDTDRRRRPYAIALGLFALALLSKTVTATMPAALLVVFWWQRGRLRLREDVLPLLPFFALGLTAGVVTSWVERTHIGAGGAEFDLSLIERGLIAGRAIWFYLAKLVWPADLVFIYRRWTIDPSSWTQFL